MTTVRKWLVEVLAPIFRVIPRIPLEDWAEANIRLREKESQDNHGPYRKRYSVYAPRILDAFMSDPEWKSLVVMKSSQSGFTLHVLILICRVVAEAAKNVLYLMDSQPKARNLSKSRLKPMLEDCKATSIVVSESEDDMANLRYELPTCFISLGGSQSAGQVASDPIGFGVLDEMDLSIAPKGEPHAWDNLQARIKQTSGGKVIGFSKPSTETGATNRGWLTGSRHRYFVPCPHCGHFQPLEMEGLQFGHCKREDGSWDLRKVLRETFYRCSSCTGRITDDDKPDMMMAGEPRPTNFRKVEVDGEEIDDPAWNPGEMSFHISDLYSLHPDSTWGHIAVEFIQAQGDTMKLRSFNQNRLGIPEKLAVAEAKDSHIRRLREKYSAGTCPVVPVFAGMAVDNQGSYQKIMRGAFMPNGDLYVIDWGKTFELEDAEAISLQPIPVPGKQIFVQRTIVDEGGKGGTSYAVRQFCAPRFPAWFPAKGRGAVQSRHTAHFVESALTRGGLEMIPVCHFDDDTFKRMLYIDRITKFDPALVAKRRLPRIFLPWNITEELIRELCGESLVKEVDDRGTPHFFWKASPPNDWGDTLKMLLVLWNLVGAEFSPVAGAGKEE